MLVMIRDVAKLVNRHPSQVLRAVKKKIPEVIREGISPKGQSVSVIDDVDLDKVKALWDTSNVLATANEVGDRYVALRKSVPVFYLTVLDPDMRPNRIKMGFSSGENDRWDVHKTVCPEIFLVATWPCRKRWESTAIRAATRIGAKKVGTSNEVFDVNGVDQVEFRLNEFFFETLEKMGENSLEPIDICLDHVRGPEIYSWQQRKQEFLSMREDAKKGN